MTEPIEDIVARWERSDPVEGHHRVLASDLSCLIASWRERGEALREIEPYLDSLVCFASTMGEDEPNRIVAKARAALGGNG